MEYLVFQAKVNTSKTDHSHNSSKMTNATPINKGCFGCRFTTKQQARVNRDKDNEWGYAWAHLVPFVDLYYACTRRTLTPVIINFVGQLTIAVVVGVAASSSDIEAGLDDGASTALWLAATPALTKWGIKLARSEKDFGLPSC